MLLGMAACSVCVADTPGKDDDGRRRATAVALNYCRASFHRIRRYESQRVLLEEQEKILNNLNLNRIADPEVMKLYSDVLDEVGQIDVSGRETEVLKAKFNKAVQRQVGTTAFVLAAHMATASLDGMVRTGVNSWLDYRDQAWTREFDVWKLERRRIETVVSKSSQFLDTFWKLAQKNNIPDEWLIRGNDLDDLEEAIQEADLQKRLRVLRRMEPYMTCYPPYWYFVGRTEQGLGQLNDAARTYRQLAVLGEGHFRRDDMLAAATANRAVILAVSGDPQAEQIAKDALRYSPAVWEANLMCAQVLEKFGHTSDAEDAILRNLDVDMEKQRSGIALLGLYYRQDRLRDMAMALAGEDFIESVPVLSIVQCAQKLGPERTPPAALDRLRKSLRVAIDSRFGKDDVLVACQPGWQAELARVQLLLPGQDPGQSLTAAADVVLHSSGQHVVRFSRVVNGASPFGNNSQSLTGSRVAFYYAPGDSTVPPLVAYLGPPAEGSLGSQGTAPWWAAGSPTEIQFGSLKLDLTHRIAAIPPSAIADSSAGDGLLRAPLSPVSPEDFRTASPDEPQSFSKLDKRPSNSAPRIADRAPVPDSSNSESRAPHSATAAPAKPATGINGADDATAKPERRPRIRILSIRSLPLEDDAEASKKSDSSTLEPAQRPVPAPPAE